MSHLLPCRVRWSWTLTTALILSAPALAEAQQVVGSRPVAVAGPSAPCNTCPAPERRPLGNFEPQPMAFLPGNGISGGGYTPMMMMNAPNLAEYGPLSMYRQVSVPVTVYSRGYNGAVTPTTATGLIYPNLPAYDLANGRSAIAFPPSRNFYRPFRSGGQAINWIDQN